MGFNTYLVSLASSFSLVSLLFVKHVWGSVQHPYVTYRHLSKGEHKAQVIPLSLLILLYLVWVTVVRNGITADPLVLSFNFLKLAGVVFATVFVVIYSFVFIGRMVGGTGSAKTVFLPWIYSLLPTLVWFFATSLLFFLFPPPRTLAFSGKLLSSVFLIFSWFLFFWKGILYYLTLRFGMKLDFFRIVLVSVIIFPLGLLYAVLLYKLGIFRIPFI